MAGQSVSALAVADEGVAAGPRLQHVGEVLGRQHAGELRVHGVVARDLAHHGGGEGGLGRVVDQGRRGAPEMDLGPAAMGDRKSTRLNSSHLVISYAVFCLKKKNKNQHNTSAASPKDIGWEIQVLIADAQNGVVITEPHSYMRRHLSALHAALDLTSLCLST